jgi:hypothetical protein
MKIRPVGAAFFPADGQTEKFIILKYIFYEPVRREFTPNLRKICRGRENFTLLALQ